MPHLRPRLLALAALAFSCGLHGSALAEGEAEAQASLMVAATTFATQNCSTLFVDEQATAAALKASGFRPAQRDTAGFKAQVRTWLEEWQGDPKGACAAILVNFGPSGRTVRNLVRPT